MSLFKLLFMISFSVIENQKYDKSNVKTILFNSWFVILLVQNIYCVLINIVSETNFHVV